MDKGCTDKFSDEMEWYLTEPEGLNGSNLQKILKIVKEISDKDCKKILKEINSSQDNLLAFVQLSQVPDPPLKTPG